MQLISCFQSGNYHVTFATACAKTDNAFDLASINVDSASIELNHSSFDDFLKQLQPDIVVFDRFMTEEQFGWRVAEVCPKALRVLDTEDLHCLRKGRELAFKEEHSFDNFYLFNDIAKREIASIYRSDLSLIISEAEFEILTQVFKVSPSILYYLPFLLQEISANQEKKIPKYQERQHFITIGNFLHPPNVQSVVYLRKHIWPLIKKQLPKAELHVYGAYPSQKVMQLNNRQKGFLVKGYAESISEVMQEARVCLAPLQFGAGLKGKLIDAMLNGTPSVMSAVAAEGLFGDLSANGFIADDEADFVNSAVALYRNEAIWNNTQQNGFKVINSRFQASEFESKFLNLLQDLKSILKLHRQENFMGQLLQHHTLQSTKYMSKWIEEKHRKNEN